MRLGITGHQRLDDPIGWRWVEGALTKILDDAETPLVGVSSLAIGTDQLFASLVVHRDGKIHVIIPFAGYERVFDADHVHAYREMLAKAALVQVLQTPGTDEDAYLAAGRRVVELVDLMIAVWDGQPAKGKGGTGDIVIFAAEQGVPLVHINPADRTVIQR